MARCASVHPVALSRRETGVSEQIASAQGASGHAPGLFLVPGDGGLARYGDLILLCSLEDSQAADALLDLLEQSAKAGGDGRQFTDAIADALETAAGGCSVLAFGPTASGVALTVSGGAWADVTTGDGTVRIEAGHPRMLLRGTLRSPVTEVRGGLSAADSGGARTDRFSRLDAGTARAGGLSFHPDGLVWQQASSQADSGAADAVQAPSAASAAWQQPVVQAPPPAVDHASEQPAGASTDELSPPAASEPPAGWAETEAPPVPVRQPTDFWSNAAPPDLGAGQPSGLVPAQVGADAAAALDADKAGAGQAFDPARPFDSVILMGAGAGGGLEAPAREPLAIVSNVPPGTSNYVSAGPMVQGVYCNNGHFDDPEARFCTVCGIPMSPQTPTSGERPPLGVLLLDDGSVFQLDDEYVLGREPTLDPSVAEGRAKPLRISDESGTISRVHLRLQLDGWRVLVTDLGSANGTRVALPGQPPPGQPIVPQVPVVLPTGSQVDLGAREFRYESHRGQ
jgi:hypothetical protein